MIQRQPKFGGGKAGAAIAVQVILQGKKDEIVEVLEDGTLKIRLSVGKDSSQTNSVLVHFLAKVLDVSPTQFDIVGGENRPEKLIAITGIDSDTTQQRILKALG